MGKLISLVGLVCSVATVANTQQEIGNTVEKPQIGDWVTLAAGEFQMGGSGYYHDETPIHTVSVPSFKIMEHEVTVSMWREYAEATGFIGENCVVHNGKTWYVVESANWVAPGFQQFDDSPVTCVSFEDIQDYISWLNEQTGENFRLPTEAEWEYAARAGSNTQYSFGDDKHQVCEYGNGADLSLAKPSWRVADCDDGSGLQTVPVKSYQANSFGLYDMHGNLWEWVQDCYSENYNLTPTDGSAWNQDDCERRVLRGGAWNEAPTYLRLAKRFAYLNHARGSNAGFRLARDL